METQLNEKIYSSQLLYSECIWLNFEIKFYKFCCIGSYEIYLLEGVMNFNYDQVLTRVKLQKKGIKPSFSWI